MINTIIHDDGSYTIEEVLQYGPGLADRGRQYALSRPIGEKDWVITRGAGNLNMCGIPVNSVVLATLEQLKGDVQLTFNFAEKDCPEYRQYMREVEMLANQQLLKQKLQEKESRNETPAAVADEELEELWGRVYNYSYTSKSHIDADIEHTETRIRDMRYSVNDASELHFNLTTIDDGIQLLITYAFYKSLIRVPYEESAADNLPTIEEVRLNGEVTDVFDTLLHYIYENGFDKIISYGHGDYYVILRKKKPQYKAMSGVIPSPKNYKKDYAMFYIGIGGVGNPLYVRMTRKEYKHAYRTRSIECTLNLYHRDEFEKSKIDGSDLHEIGNDYMHSGTASIIDILHFAVAFPYLVSIIIGRYEQQERDVIIGYDTTLYSKVDGQIVPSHVIVEYHRSECINRIWNQLINNYRYYIY
ncbi:MAG: hypothetical protein NC548_06335 [Lachnospiraceae bacterium]|nr:hypothetical protein [Lachnospiraceae bacterium]